MMVKAYLEKKSLNNIRGRITLGNPISMLNLFLLSILPPFFSSFSLQPLPPLHFIFIINFFRPSPILFLFFILSPRVFIVLLVLILFSCGLTPIHVCLIKKTHDLCFQCSPGSCACYLDIWKWFYTGTILIVERVVFFFTKSKNR